jgi:hypothetical protein
MSASLRVVEREDHRVYLNEICWNSERSTVVDPTMDALVWACRQADQADSDPLREMQRRSAKELQGRESRSPRRRSLPHLRLIRLYHETTVVPCAGREPPARDRAVSGYTDSSFPHLRGDRLMTVSSRSRRHCSLNRRQPPGRAHPDPERPRSPPRSGLISITPARVEQTPGASRR